MARVKICGITNIEDASLAVRLGADALGLIFAPGPRQVTPQKARAIIRALPPFVETVGVFVDQDLAAIRKITAYCGIDLVQLHGKETPEFCDRLGPRVIKAFRVKGPATLSSLRAYRDRVRALLLDSYEKGKKGGTGKPFDWHLAVEAKTLGMPVILAGGLGPSNIQGAIRTVRPYAVDVNSGIEQSPGKKDPALMQRLMEKVRKANDGGEVDV